MMSKAQKAFAILLMALLIGCTAQPDITLEQKLAGQGEEARKEILYNECRQEAKHNGVDHRLHFERSDLRDVEGQPSQARLLSLCNEINIHMTDED